LEDYVHQGLEGCRGIGEPKGHYPEFPLAMVAFEGCFMLILELHPDLVISRPHIQLGEPCSPM
jgi:hypothetical protein